MYFLPLFADDNKSISCSSRVQVCKWDENETWHDMMTRKVMMAPVVTTPSVHIPNKRKDENSEHNRNLQSHPIIYRLIIFSSSLSNWLVLQPTNPITTFIALHRPNTQKTNKNLSPRSSFLLLFTPLNLAEETGETEIIPTINCQDIYRHGVLRLMSWLVTKTRTWKKNRDTTELFVHFIILVLVFSLVVEIPGARMV